MANRFLNNITINDEYTLPSADGTADQIITTDGSGQLSFVDQNTISAGNAEHVVIYAKNTHTASIAKGTPVYITGTVGATDTVEIAPADAGNSAKMPAVGLLDATLAVNAFGYVITGGFMDNITTDPIDGATPTSNDTVYVKVGGGLTLTKPTGPTGLIQNVAKVGKVSGGNSGSLIVSSILRTNDVPNLTTGKIWVGDGNTVESTVVHLDEPNGRMGIGTTAPVVKLDVNSSGVAAFFKSSSNQVPVSIFSASTRSTIGFKGSTSTSEYHVRVGADSKDFVAYTNNTEKLRILENGNVGIGTTSPNYKFVVSNGTQTGTFNPNSSGFMFLGSTSNHPLYFGVNDQTKMALLDNGNVGIGTTSPGVKLDVRSSTTGNLAGRVWNPNTGTNSSATFRIASSANNANSARLEFSDAGYYTATVSGDRVQGLVFRTSATGSDPITIPERMRISSNGNVGIGTTSPGTKLDVAGNANITDTLAIGSLSTVPTASLGRALNIQVLANSSGTTVAQWLDVDRTITTNSTSANTYGMLLRNASTTTSTANDGNIYGAQIIGRHQGTGGINSAMGVRGTADINTTGTITTTGSLWGAYNEGQVTNGSVTFSNSGIYGTASIAQVLGSGTVNITTRGIVGVGSVGRINNVNANVNRVVAGEFELDLQNGATEQAHVISLNTYNITSPTNLSIDEFAYIYLGEDVAIPTTVTDNAYFIKSLTSLPSELAGSIEATSFIKTGGTSSQFLKADGSVDSTSYAPATGGSYLPLSAGSSYPLTGVLYIGGTIRNNSGDLEIRNQTATGFATATKLKQQTVNGLETFLTLDGTTRYTTFEAGNVGIGETSPSSKLEVRAETATHKLVSLNRAASTTAAMYLGNDSSNNAIISSNYSDLIFGRDQSSTLSEWMRIKRDGNVGIGTTSPAKKLHVLNSTNEAQIRLGQSGSGSYDIGVYSGDKFSIGRDADTQEFTLSNGNVGIGTASPTDKLTVNGNLSIFGNKIYNGSASNSAGVSFPSSTTRIDGYNGITFHSSTTTVGSQSERMRITSAGDTGIGVTVPRAKLDVAGGIKVADDTDTAGANKVGTLRYRTSGNNSYVDMCMQTGASTYEWINVVQNNW